jgi:NAD(P)-dependent dehydrogenase (short-subunit alcohol dehydrogenase family)
MTETLILITGASRGLGAALAAALAGPAAHVVAVARTVGGLEETDDRVQAAGGSATLAPMDLTDEDRLRQLCRAIHDRWGRIDLMIHAAIHAPPLSPAAHIDPGVWARTLDVNLRATERLIALAAPLLRAAPAGRAVFFDDPRAGQKFFAAYGASKAAQIALARSWQAETARTGPAVTILEPRPMATALRARFFPGEDRARLAPPAVEAARLAAALRADPV